MRLKGDKNSLTKNINLFPDACNISLNNKSIKEFTPLHRQSSLKFRRDDVLNISNSVVQGTNKLVLH